MAFLDIFRTNRASNNTENEIGGKPEIQEEIFTYKANDYLNPTLHSIDATMDGVYNYLRGDYHNKGYADCLVNSEPKYREDNIEVLLLDLELLIDQTTQKYNEELRDIDFHMQSRSDEGLTNLVSQLEVRKKVIGEYLEKLSTFRTDAINREKTALKIIKSYSKGFQRGLVALSSSQLLNKELENE